VQESQDRIAWELNAKRLGSDVDVLVDGPAEDPTFAFEGRMAGQAPEIDGVVYLRDIAPDRPRRRISARPTLPLVVGADQPRRSAFTPGHFARVRIVEAEGHELVGERA
jgi:tRNA A37 methylthiotransferase MiaB